MPTAAIATSSRWRSLASSDSLALLVDLDGTMIEFAPSPDQAVLDADLILLLNHLVNSGVRVLVVSGRASGSIDAMRSSVPGAWWAAEHGSWLWAPELVRRPPMKAPELDDLVERLGALVTIPGVLVERKSLSVCIHWRQVPDEQRMELVAQLEMRCDEWLEERPSFERLCGVDVIEVRQRSVHKGSVVTWLRHRMPAARIIAIGDDTTDEDMFAALDDCDACVRVGDRPIHADASVPHVKGARAFLRWIADVRRGRDWPPPITLSLQPAARKRHRLLVMSNRTPTVVQGRAREVGGLVSALEPALRNEHGIWLGWSGQERGEGSRVVIDTSNQPARARFDLPATMRQQFYAGFCNRVLWPLFHGFPNRVRYSDGDWDAYIRVNERFARHGIEVAQRDATVWVHDYHLLLVGRALRALGHEGKIGLFLHIPFPTRESLETIPWAKDIVGAMHEFDLVGFQTPQHASNFLDASRGVKGSRVTEVGAFPATIDPMPFRTVTPEVREVAGLREAIRDRKLILGVDRLDYSKGVPERLDAYERLLDRYPEWHRRVSFLQISVPSRAEIPDYAELRQRVEGMVGRINGRFGDPDWVPVRYLYRSYDQDVLAQMYRLADVALVTPLRDGMNLVAKEFVAAQIPDAPGVLVLSQYAGAAESLASALVTNPFHPERLAADIDHALRMPATERMQRHKMLLAAMEREGDARAWAEGFLDRLAPRRLHSVD